MPTKESTTSLTKLTTVPPEVPRCLKLSNLFLEKHRPLVVKNDEGALVDTDEEKLEILKHYYTDKYDGTAIEPLTKIGELNDPITSEEVSKAAASLSNNKAPGPEWDFCSRAAH